MKSITYPVRSVGAVSDFVSLGTAIYKCSMQVVDGQKRIVPLSHADGCMAKPLADLLHGKAVLLQQTAPAGPAHVVP